MQNCEVRLFGAAVNGQNENGDPRAAIHRRGDSEHTSFDFLGYTFRGRFLRGRRGLFVSFTPAISTKALKAKGLQIRAWHLNRLSGTDLSGLAEAINPQVRGWINYFGRFYRSGVVLPRLRGLFLPGDSS
jgi:hypothetical protein